ncbi:uncharacterized protein BBOV_IV007140 [Babesia bovis T2Bo]|uniref:Membrane protein, putative n=1 Tax=Babesia bovis TaxID=5865 RepID=A7ARA1_BABBO|nr:uncharacterized protein BBOV_IV007140 [Babesia bovis T2Bo]EDO07070.1 hypothetical protein BBOV_IV007140 [Babesia bovis T2Bo]BAN64158.1 membrane protein, putative [Babesia bovis]|eukprot:XP_001610638.1 hypothetical protein [Babesia bovis T2Bo]
MASQSTVSFNVHSVGAVRRSSFGKMTAWVLFFVALFNLFNGVAVADVEVDMREQKECTIKPPSDVASSGGTKVFIPKSINVIFPSQNACAPTKVLTDEDKVNIERNLRKILAHISYYRPKDKALKPYKKLVKSLKKKESMELSFDMARQLALLGGKYDGTFPRNNAYTNFIFYLADMLTKEGYGPLPNTTEGKKEWYNHYDMITEYIFQAWEMVY